MTIKKCHLNGHTCCSVRLCGSCCPTLDFEIYGKDENPRTDVKLRKIHSGCYREWCSGGDQYDFTPPQDATESAIFHAGV